MIDIYQHLQSLHIVGKKNTNMPCLDSKADPSWVGWLGGWVDEATIAETIRPVWLDVNEFSMGFVTKQKQICQITTNTKLNLTTVSQKKEVNLVLKAGSVTKFLTNHPKKNP